MYILLFRVDDVAHAFMSHLQRTPVYNLNTVKTKSNEKRMSLHLRFTMSFDYNCLLRTGSMPGDVCKTFVKSGWCVCVCFFYFHQIQWSFQQTEHSSYLNVEQIASCWSLIFGRNACKLKRIFFHRLQCDIERQRKKNIITPFSSRIFTAP